MAKFGADRRAKLGARLHPPLDHLVKAYNDRFRFITILCKYLARVSVRAHDKRIVPYDAAPDRRKLPRPRARRVCVRLRDKRHAPCKSDRGDTHFCWRCCQAAVCLRNLERRPCVPVGDLGHSLWDLGERTFCSRCGAYAQSRFRLLAKPCAGPPPPRSTRSYNLSKLRRGWVGKEFVGRPTPSRPLPVGNGGLSPPRYLQAAHGLLADQPIDNRQLLGEVP